MNTNGITVPLRFRACGFEQVRERILGHEGPIVIYTAPPGAGKSTLVRSPANGDDEVTWQVYALRRALPLPWEIRRLVRRVGSRDLLRGLLPGRRDTLYRALVSMYVHDVGCWGRGPRRVVVVDEFSRYYLHRLLTRQALVWWLAGLMKEIQAASGTLVLVTDILIHDWLQQYGDVDTSWIEYAWVTRTRVSWFLPIPEILGRVPQAGDIGVVRHGALFLAPADGEGDETWQEVVASGLWPTADQVPLAEFVEEHGLGGYVPLTPPEGVAPDRVIFGLPALVAEALRRWPELRGMDNEQRSAHLARHTLTWGWRRFTGMGVRPLAQVLFGETYYAELYRFLSDYCGTSLDAIRQRMGYIRRSVCGRRADPYLVQEYLFWQRYVVDGWMAPAMWHWQDVVRAPRSRSWLAGLVHFALFSGLTAMLGLSGLSALSGWAPGGLLGALIARPLPWALLWLGVWVTDFHALMNELVFLREDLSVTDMPGDVQLLAGTLALDAMAIGGAALIGGSKLLTPAAAAGLVLVGLLYLVPRVFWPPIQRRLPWVRFGASTDGALVSRAFGVLAMVAAGILALAGAREAAAWVLLVGVTLASLFWMRGEVWRISLRYAFFAWAYHLRCSVRGGDEVEDDA